MSARRIATALTALALLGGCGGSGTGEVAFSHQFADNQVDDMTRVVARLPEARAASRPENASGAALAVVTTHEAPRQVAARPEILGDIVLTSERHRVVALDLATGRMLWERNLPDLAYVGSDREGQSLTMAFTVGATGGARRR